MAAAAIGRGDELELIDAFLAESEERPAALVLEGEAGIGKTTVWREGITRAARERYRVLSCRAVAAEARLSFAALGDLLGPVDEAAFVSLPDPQRRALDAALLRSEPERAAPDPRAIGTGVVSLVSGLAADGPVLLAVDDVQWLDRPSARALEFALRRLEGRAVALLATRRLDDSSGRAGPDAAIPEVRVRRLRLGPLSVAALYRIVEGELGRGLPRPLLVRISHATGGNPFYVLEIARALEREGRPAPGEALPVPDDLRKLVAMRLHRLPRRTQAALLRVSALAQPTVSLVDPADLGPAEEAGVARIRADGRIELTHPLFAGAVYASASLDRRRRLHGQLAELVADPEERVRHLLLANPAGAPDEQLAAAVHDAAEVAYRRGAPEAAAELMERAVALTPPRVAAAATERRLRAAWYHLKAGDPQQAKMLGEAIAAAPASPPARARALQLLAEVYLTENPPAAIPLLEEAIAAAAGDFGHAAQLEISLGIILVAVAEVAQADQHAIRAAELAEPAGDAGLLTDAIAFREVLSLVSGRGVDELALERALLLEDPDREVPLQQRAALNVAQVYEWTGRGALARDLLVRLRDRVVARGEEADLPWILVHLAGTAWLAGELAVAELEADDAVGAANLAGQEMFSSFALMIRALVRATRGESTAARVDASEALAICERIGWLVGMAQNRYALGFLALSEGDPRETVTVLEPVIAAVEANGVYEWVYAMSLPDAIEALVATGELDRAETLTGALMDWGRRFDRPWALATGGRCRGLLLAARRDLDGALAALEGAVLQHERLEMPLERGRTLLVLGQLHRRRKEKRAARAALDEALAVFEQLGAPLWAVKARAELGRVAPRHGSADTFTPTEERVAGLAASGLTNREIGERLFLSPKTVEANLARVYRKLGIHSRAELGVRMTERGSAAEV
jgi:DNA-binding CsgD family transcriptional regulator